MLNQTNDLLNSTDNGLYDFCSESNFSIPVFNFTQTKSIDETPLHSPMRMNLFVIAHVGFFLFNFINVFAILFIHGYIFKRLWHNHLMHTALCACACQMLSCWCSIYRYNHCEEFGTAARASVWTGLVAYIFMNYTMAHIFCNRQLNKNVNCVILVWFWFLSAIACGITGDFYWKKYDFRFFRYYILGSTIFQLISYISVLWSFSKKDIRISRNSPLKVWVTDALMKRMLHVAIVTIVLTMGYAYSLRPILQYPGTGITFSVMVLVVTFVGEMDFMEEGAIARSVPGCGVTENTLTDPEMAPLNNNNTSIPAV